MKELYELKDMLTNELKSYGKKGDLTAGSLDVVDKLSHALKNLDKIIESCEEEKEGYSNGYPMYVYGRSYRNGENYGTDGMNNNTNGSYARGRRNARRDSMGRYSSEGYSRHGDMIAELRELMEDAPDERTRQEFQRFISKMESM